MSSNSTSSDAAAITEALFGPGVDSPSRLTKALDLLADTPGRVFWPVLFDCWPSCDDMWIERERLRWYFSFHARTRRRYLPSIALHGIDAIPRAGISVYRGCDSNRVDGLSWTTSRTVAEEFARGHRGIRVLNPVIVEAIAKPAAVYFAMDARGESELVIDPRRLMHVRAMEG